MGFAAAQSGWSFTLQSFARLYADVYGIRLDTAEFARRLWGDVYFHPDTRTFRKKPPAAGGERAFVQFILEPLYKVYSQVGPRPCDAESTVSLQFRSGVCAGWFTPHFCACLRSLRGKACRRTT